MSSFDQLPLLFDEHLAAALAVRLRREGADIETVAEAGFLGADDGVVIAHRIKLRQLGD